MSTSHIPVLAEHVLQLLTPQLGDRYVDGTAGYGGHASKVLEEMGPTGRAVLVDRDPAALTALHDRFDADSRVRIINSDYLSAAEQLLEQKQQFDMVLLDIGVSSPQLDQPERGFSFQSDGPLDMRMDTTSGQTAADIVNTLPVNDLADLIYLNGEERKSRRIAAAIVAARPLSTTKQLADVIVKAIGRPEKIHPATRTFQALRIAVNDELEQLRQALPLYVRLLEPGGRIAVISFHSLEDRIVKDFFNRESRDCICPPAQPICTCDHVATIKRLTRKAVAGTEDAFNPRARSAKLRAAEKLTPKGDLDDVSHSKPVPAR